VLHALPRPADSTKPRPAVAPLPKENPFRHDLPKATSSQDAWHYFLLAACCVLFCDVFCRRVHVNFGWVPPLAGRARDWVLRRQPKAATPEFMQRLRSRKAEVSGQLDQIHIAAAGGDGRPGRARAAVSYFRSARRPLAG
jgi:hypothetical protein